jgi:pyruvate-formate lyase-activating enzyme
MNVDAACLSRRIGLGNVERVDVLPFHQMGRFKWQALGLRYELHDVQPPAASVVERACATFRAARIESILKRGRGTTRRRARRDTERTIRRFRAP